MTLLIRPASGLCNMRCGYCFYADEIEHRSTQSLGIMSFDTAEKTARKAIEYSKADGAVGFMFQSGECKSCEWVFLCRSDIAASVQSELRSQCKKQKKRNRKVTPL